MSLRSALAALFVPALPGLIFAQLEDPVGSPYPPRLASSVLRAKMLPSNEVPAVQGLDGDAAVTVRPVFVLDRNLRQGSYVIDFVVGYRFSEPVTVTGLHIHSGRPGTNGPVVVDSGIKPEDPLVLNAGRGTITRQVTTNFNFGDLENNPGAYYVNLHTSRNPDGAVRGPLARAQQVVVMGLMKPENEVPAIAGLAASATGAVVATVTRDVAGTITTAEVSFHVEFAFPPQSFLSQINFTGLHVHAGGAGVNAPVVLDSGLRSVAVPDTGKGSLHFRNEMDVTNPAVVAALEGLARNPLGHYINLHTTANPGGAVRAQLRRTDGLSIGSDLVRALDSADLMGTSGDAAISTYLLRDEEGRVEAGLVSFLVFYRGFSPGTEFVGLHIHQGASGTNGPVKIDSGLTAANAVKSETGTGFLIKDAVVSTAEAVAALEEMLIEIDKSGYYVNLHTRATPGGAIHGPVGSTGGFNQPGFAEVAAAISAASDPSVTAAAPGGLISIYGRFFLLPATAGGLGQPLPRSLNGVRVFIGGREAPLAFVSRTQINAQVPVELTAGNQVLYVRIGGTLRSNNFDLPVRRYAPAIFLTEGGGLVFNAGGELVRPSTPARPGGVVTVWATGLGQTNPELGRGAPAPDPPASTDPVTATVGGTNADVVSSVAAPGLVGVYTVTLRVPAGQAAGSYPLLLRIGEAVSNTVTLEVGP